MGGQQAAHEKGTRLTTLAQAKPRIQARRPSLRIGRTVVYFMTITVLAMSATAIGPTLPGLAVQTASSLSAISALFSARAIVRMVGTTLAGRAYDRLPGHILMGSALAAICLTYVFAMGSPQLIVLMLAFAMVGFAEGFVDVGVNALLIWNHRGYNASPYINGLHAFFGVGAFIMPLLVAQMVLLNGQVGVSNAILTPFLALDLPEAIDSVTSAYQAIGLLFLPSILLLFLLPSPTARATNAPSDNVVRTPWAMVLLSAALLGVYVGAEASFSGWVYTYAIETDLMNTADAAGVVSVFWGTIMVGRLAVVPLSAIMLPRHILILALLGSLASTGLMLTAPSSLTLWLGAVGLGLSMSSIFPTVLAFADRHMTITAGITSYFFIGAGLGVSIMPWLVGQVFEPIGPHMLFVIVLGGVLLMCLIFVLLMRQAAVLASHNKEDLT